MTSELETELRAEIERLREVNAELSVTKGVQILRLEVTPAQIAGHSLGVRVMVTASLGEEYGAMAMQMVSMCLAQIGGAVAAAGMTPPAPEATS